MKKALIVLAIALCCCLVMVACFGPSTPNTSAVAGTYFKEDAAGNHIEDNWIELKGDGTWTSSNPNPTENKKTFTLANNNTEISIYLGASRIMYGTINADTGVMELKVWAIVTWQDAVFSKMT